MTIFITGGKGQLGSALARRYAANQVQIGDLPDFDITDYAQVQAVIAASGAQAVIHCAAYTHVDGCAKDPQKAFLINGVGTQNIALACATADIPMLHISTNEVFPGTASTPYSEFDPTAPANPYGKSKLAAEWYVQTLLRKFYIVRTSWLYAAGGTNFIHRIQQLADERGALQVVDDEIGAPTWVEDLADACVRLLQTERYGIYHLVNSGYTSRYEFAKTILALTNRSHVPITPIKLADFPRPSTPPRFGALANWAGAAAGITLRPWQAALTAFLSQ
jgi:dTDP-4-dehydrorhamnose reductase